MPFWHDHVVFPGQITLELPRGNYFFTIEHGPEYTWEHRNFAVDRNYPGVGDDSAPSGVDMASHAGSPADLMCAVRLDEMACS